MSSINRTKTPKKNQKESTKFSANNSLLSLETNFSLHSSQSFSSTSSSPSNKKSQGNKIDFANIQEKKTEENSQSSIKIAPTDSGAKSRNFVPVVPTTQFVLVPAFQAMQMNPLQYCHSKRKLTLNNKNWGNITTDPNVNKFNTIKPAFIFFPKPENTEILKVNIKLSKNNTKVFRIRKFDDVFLSLDFFFKVNKISNISLLRPIAFAIFNALSSISCAMNNKIEKEEQNYLNSIYQQWKKIKRSQ